MTADETGFALAHAAQRKAVRKRRRARAAGPAAPAGPPRRSPSQQAGHAAETLALRHLRAAGLALVARNVACRAGEIDLVMRDGDTLVFVEVRARGAGRFGGAAASVDHAKRQRLIRAAGHFLQTLWRGPVLRCRFDVVAFEAGQPPRWIRHAFEA